MVASTEVAGVRSNAHAQRPADRSWPETEKSVAAQREFSCNRSPGGETTVEK